MTQPQLSLSNIVPEAEWLAHRYDPQYDAFHFRFVPRARHAEIPFLTDDHLGPVEPLAVRREEAVALASPPAPIHFIFHSAYCCSTLLAAAFDIPGVAMGLKEPVLFNDLIGWRLRGATGPQVARVLDEGLRLLARPFGAGEAVVVKPSNIINPLIPAILSMRPQSRALLLYAPLDDYLASIARKGMWGRLWVRDGFEKLAREGMIAPLGIMPDQYMGLTDIQVAAAGWRNRRSSTISSGSSARGSPRWTAKLWSRSRAKRLLPRRVFMTSRWTMRPLMPSSQGRSSHGMPRRERPSIRANASVRRGAAWSFMRMNWRRWGNGRVP